MRLSIVLVVLFFSAKLFSKTPGQWTGHFAYSNILHIAEVDGILYCATNNALFSYNIDENVILKYSKVFRLSDIDISSISPLHNLGYVAIGYMNGNVDLFRNGSVINISDIKLKSIFGSKMVNSVIEINSLLYIAFDLGIVVYDVNKREVKESYFINKNGDNLAVKDLCVLNDSIYIATDKGVFASNYDSLNLSLPSSWQLIGNADVRCGNIASHANKIFFTQHNDSASTVNYYDSDTVHEFLSVKEPYCKLRVSHDHLMIVDHSTAKMYDTAMFVKKVVDSDLLFNRKNDATYYNGEMWVALELEGIVSDMNLNRKIYASGPASDFTASIVSKNGVLYFASGKKDAYSVGIVNILKDDKWGYNYSWSYQDLTDIAVRSIDDYYISSWSDGVIHYQNNSYAQIDAAPEDEFLNQLRADGLEFDSKGNLWFIMYGVAKPLKVLTAQGVLYEYSVSNITSSRLINMMIDSKDRKWITTESGILIVDAMSDFSVLGSARHFIAYDQKTQPFSSIHSVVEDNDGAIWIGTSTGFGVYQSQTSVFDEKLLTFSRVSVIVEDNEQKYMLHGARIKYIKVDAANRKWIGTEGSGVFLLSANGTEIIMNLNQENSKLPSDNVTTIGFNENTGEVFFGTDKGLVSFQSDAISTKENYDEIDIFPNPVHPHYTKEIFIKGLVANTTVSITDMEGNLVKKITALGGQALWDGMDAFGKRVRSGVYLVFCTNDDGSKTKVGKIFFIN